MSHIRHFEVGCEIAKMFLAKYAFVEQITKSGIYGGAFFPHYIDKCRTNYYNENSDLLQNSDNFRVKKSGRKSPPFFTKRRIYVSNVAELQTIAKQK